MSPDGAVIELWEKRRVSTKSMRYACQSKNLKPET